MNFQGLLRQIGDALGFDKPAVITNLIQGKKWNQDIPMFGGAAPTPVPAEAATPTPTPTPVPVPGFHIPDVPDNVAQVIGHVMQNQGVPMDATASAKILNHPYGPQIKGTGTGENPNFQTVLDTFNRIDENGNYNDNAPIKQILNPETGQMENSTDRGLWRINNESFYDYKRRFPEVFKQYDINSYEDMNDPIKNTVVGKLVLQYQGGAGYYAAPEDMANFGLLP
jgi:hypothetical protein